MSIKKDNSKKGVVYTPSDIADMILEISGWTSDIIVKRMTESTSTERSSSLRKIIDPSCGNGALLVPATRELIMAMKTIGRSNEEIKKAVLYSINGIEINNEASLECAENITRECDKHGIKIDTRELNIINGDAIEICRKGNIGTFDHVVGNPPYIRIHEFDKTIASRYAIGMTDMFYVFYDIGQDLMDEGGSLVYISPSSWFCSRAGKKMRKDLESKKAISDIVDFKEKQVFDDASTYTAIVKLTDERNDSITLHTPEHDESGFRIAETKTVKQDSCWHNGMLAPEAPPWIDDVLSATGKVRVMMGYQTGSDSIFVSDSPRGFGSLEIPCVKSSKATVKYALYPYDIDGNLLSLEDIESINISAKKMLLMNKNTLLSRNGCDDNNWWGYSRSQGISSTYEDKTAMQLLIDPEAGSKCIDAPAGTGVYGGAFALGARNETITEALHSNEFANYATSLHKYKRGGYCSVSSTEMQNFLNWWVNR